MCRSSLRYQSKLSLAQLLRTKNFPNEPDSTNNSIEDAVQETSHGPSHNDSESPDPINLVAHFTPPSQVDVPVDDEAGDSKKMLGTNEDGEASENWETVSDLASDMARAARNALFSRKHFKKVVAVIAYWETATGLEHLRDQADKLGRLFEDRFKFEVFVYKIPERVSNRELIPTIGSELDRVADDPDSLFILYYGGHAAIVDYPRVDLRLWKKEDNIDSPSIDWSTAIRMLFESRIVCNKLFIFDCCQAGGMIDPTLRWETSCELLGACAADVKRSALIASPFTAGLLEELSKNTYDIWELHSALCSTDKRTKYNLANPPHYHNFVGRRTELASTLMKKVGSPEETENRPRRPSDILARLTTISDAVICVTITFRCTADALVEEFKEIKRDWSRRFRFAATDFDDIIVKACRGPKLLAAFDSESCITIWTFPVWLWDAMAPVSGHKHIGIVSPQNFVLAASGPRTGPPLTNCSSRISSRISSSSSSSSSSSMTVREASVSRQPKEPSKFPPVLDTILEGTTEEYRPHVRIKKAPA